MWTVERCLARAEEAERLAALVSYERDRVRLRRQAQEWRDKARELAEAAAVPQPEAPPPALVARVRRWLGLTR